MMKRLLFPILLFFSLQPLFGQNFSGQWKGGFIDKSTSFMNWGGDQCDYTLELEVKGTKVSGYSYTYFSNDGKKYYTICRLSGIMDPKRKYLEVTETERTKTNVPVNINNCFQVHKLNFVKKEGEEILQGSWSPAPGQDGDCGFGTTQLRRRVLKDIIPGFKKVAAGNKTTVAAKNNPAAVPKKNNTVVAGRTPAITEKKAPAIAGSASKALAVKKDTAQKLLSETIATKKITEAPQSGQFEKRSSNIIKTIAVKQAQVKVDLYDNGEIDGDTVSVFFNGKLLLAHKKLTTRALSLSVDIDPSDNAVNELVMYADNLGSIPPNTALMVVTDGDKRYEVRISSDLKKSGAIRFVHDDPDAKKIK